MVLPEFGGLWFVRVIWFHGLTEIGALNNNASRDRRDPVQTPIPLVGGSAAGFTTGIPGYRLIQGNRQR